jgi:peptide/nickel transport system permease protein/oligopeptide transport system permease protein
MVTLPSFFTRKAMITYVIKRIFWLVLVLFAVSVVVFFLLHLCPGDPAIVVAGPGASKEDIAKIRAELNLDKPVYLQYYIWLRSILRGDLGRSAITRETVIEMIGSRLFYTMELAGAGIFIAMLLGMPAGLIAAVKHYSIFDSSATIMSLFGVSMPIFWIGLMLMFLFAVKLRWLPAIGAGGIDHLILPALTIGMNSTAIIARMTRSSILEIIGRDFIRTARAKGCKERVVILKHTLKNAMIPIITAIGLQFGYLMAGAVLTETVFARPGIGKLLADAVFNRDFPLIQGLTLIIATSFVIINLLVDISYTFFDPRIVYG